MNKVFVKFILISTIFWLSAFSPIYSEEQNKTVDNLEIFYGVVPAEIIGSQTDTSGINMHGKQNLDRDSYHLVVAIFDIETGRRITDANIRATVTPLGLASIENKLEPMLIAQTTSYGGFFKLPKINNPVRIKFEIQRSSVSVHTTAEFTYWLPNNP